MIVDFCKSKVGIIFPLSYFVGKQHQGVFILVSYMLRKKACIKNIVHISWKFRTNPYCDFSCPRSYLLNVGPYFTYICQFLVKPLQNICIPCMYIVEVNVSILNILQVNSIKESVHISISYYTCKKKHVEKKVCVSRNFRTNTCCD